MNPFTALKNLSPFSFTFYFFFILFFHLTYQPFTSVYLLFISTNHFPSLQFPSLYTFHRLHFPSLVFTFLTIVLKICFLPWKVPITPSSSLFQSVMDLFTKEYFRMSVLCFGSDFPIMLDPT